MWGSVLRALVGWPLGLLGWVVLLVNLVWLWRGIQWIHLVGADVALVMATVIGTLGRGLVAAALFGLARVVLGRWPWPRPETRRGAWGGPGA